MSEHKTQLVWQRTTADFDWKTYNREHTVRYKNGQTISGSAATAFFGSPDCVDPEEMFTGSLSSCHMLTFLAIASKKRFIVDAYNDEATGYLEKNESGKMMMTRVILRPDITFGGVNLPTDQELHDMHELAHKQCFIANSVTTEVVIQPL
ncbi:MAG: OsmC family protein [SAR324 cluster bacterium]|nr:OsmC family protein [SAR324 cluster bacterium]